MTTHLHLLFLGALQITLDGEPLTAFESDKVRALLVYLALETGRPHRRAALAEMFWPDRSNGVARNSLRQALANLRKTIGDREAAPPFLHVTHTEIQFNPDSAHWLDVTACSALLDACQAHRHRRVETCKPCIERLRQAVALYRGPFLEQFYLGDSVAFEEWALVRRERYRRQTLEALATLTTHHMAQAEYAEAEAATRRQLEIDDLCESAWRGLMEALARAGQRNAALAAYETYCQLLQDELGVTPAAETTALYEGIRAGELDAGAPSISAAPTLRGTEILPQPPAFLAAEVQELERPVFVARERELERLDEFFQAALEGQGQVIFVTGGPGRGKTALMSEFARRAMETRPDLLVANGNCNAYSGVGDPYLPFREVMAMLTADVEARWAAGSITRDHARRLWTALPLVVRVLLDHGPHLVDVFFSGAALLSRATSAAQDGAPWLEPLRAYAERQRISSTGLEQSHLFQQFTNVLRALAEERPLLLILDDAQWVDSASTGLLFHLGRRLEGSQVLVACAYRPEEVALGRPLASLAQHPEHSGSPALRSRLSSAEAAGASETGQSERHPLEKVLSEFKRRTGDVWVHLGQAQEAEGRRFVDAFLETEPNRLDEAFREALFRHTGGHPLFTVELLRAMQERGDLVQDEDGQWVMGAALDWETLPARVEGVIEERVGRLEEELREILTVASVEGEEFTAQVVARVGEIGERQLLRKLSQELEKRHRLVREQGELVVARQRLSRYRFAHALFQGYLYNSLGKGERRLLHREIGAVLEELYEGHTGEIAAQLARHYAGDAEKERHYARLAGERAAAAYANDEALRYLSRALELTPETDSAARYTLLLAREKVYDFQGAREAQTQDLEALEALAEAIDDDRLRAEVGLRQASYYTHVTGDYPAAVAAAQKAIRLGQTAQYVDGEAAGRFRWGHALFWQEDLDAARFQLEQGLALARAAGFRQVEANSLRNLGVISFRQGDYAGARDFYEQALPIHREIGDRPGEGTTINNLAWLLVLQGEQARAKAYWDQSLRIHREIGNRLGEAFVLTSLGNVSSFNLGDYAEARAFFEQALCISREIGERRDEIRALENLGDASRRYGSYAKARVCFQQCLRISREIGDQSGEGWALCNLGRVSHSQGDYAGARAHYEQGLPLFREIGNRHGEGSALAWLGLQFHHVGDDEAAREYSQQALLIAQELGNRNLQSFALTYQGHALAGLGHQAEAADAYGDALDIVRDLFPRHLTTGSLAGLARVALAQGDAPQAQARVEEILSYLESGILDCADELFHIYLTYYRVLKANQDPRAEEILDTARRLLQERAARISDEELRRSFLENVAVHWEILSEFASH